MSLTATYSAVAPSFQYGGVRLTVAGAPAGSDYAFIERSVDGITWTTVRGGDRVQLNANACILDDYEFPPGSTSQYRARYIDADLIPSFRAVGTAQSGNNTPLTPPHPAGLATGDLKVIAASIRTGTVNAPAGWLPLVTSGNVTFLGKIHAPGDVAPLVTFAGGAAGDDTLAQMGAFINAKLQASNIMSQFNAVAAQDIAGPANTQIGLAMLMTWGWKADDFTSVSTPAFGTKIQDWSSTAGNDAGMTWDFNLIPLANNGLPTNPFPLTVTGGATATSRGGTFFLVPIDYTGTDTASVTPALAWNEYWLKNPSRPGNNIRITITEVGDITRPARTARFDVLGRTVPVAVSDLAGGRQFDMALDVLGNAAADDMDNRLASGDPMYLQAPGPAKDVPTMYFVCGDFVRSRDAKGSTSQTFHVPVFEVAAPGSTVAGATYLWSDVIANYADWNAVIAANATWGDLINRISNTIIIVT